ncbi:MAG TPA: hypothetical protein VN836_13125 [Verrucomicrobiae bacterium]|nr:hypothetical protein [Verrucomicrobiae bacterium]
MESPTCGREQNLRRAWSNWIGLAVVAAAFAFAAAKTWRRWPDLIGDFGVQMYIPWRLSEGAVLYRDIFYFTGGPLSQYYHALLFKIFGVSFLTIIIANLTAVAALLWLTYRRFRAAADAWTATAVGLGIVLVFAFAQYTTIANYNYIAPYSHEALHGLILSILAVALLSDWMTKGRRRLAVGAGFCAGLVFLTKPDIFTALAICAVVAFTLHGIVRRRMGFVVKSAEGFVLAALLPALGFFLFFLGREDWRQSLRSVLAGWTPLFQTDVVKDPYYQWCLGFDQPATHLRDLAVQSVFAVAALVLLALVFHAVRNQKPGVQWTVSLMLVVPAVLAIARFNASGCGAALPLLAVSACVLLRWQYQKFPEENAVVFPLLWNVFGLVLLLKMGLFPRLFHYGFVLAMPAFVGAVYLLLWLLPQLLERKFQVPPRYLRAAVGLMLLAGFVHLFQGSEQFYAVKNLAVGRGGDRIIAAGPSGHAVEARSVETALEWIEKNVPRDATLATLPQDAMLNYFSRHINPTPCLDWSPNMLQVFGASNMTAAFEKAPPDYVTLVEWKPFALGVDYFGRDPDYGRELMQWINAHYQPVQLIGREPLQNGLFGIKILKREPTNSVATPVQTRQDKK